MNSCSSESSEIAEATTTTEKLVHYQHNAIEVEAMDLINEYRISIGLNALKRVSLISLKSQIHNFYMIENNVISHDGFVSRSNELSVALGATNIGENIAYNFNSPVGALAAWIASPAHKENLEGDYTHFGISVTECPETGKKYYTNIFAKI